MLEVRNLVKSFGNLRAVDDVSFTVAPNTITGLIGPNGAGKTTLFNTLAGDYRPDAGTVTLDGKRIDAHPPHRIFHRGLARTYQIPRPFYEMTVLENVMLVPPSQLGERFWNCWFAGRRVRRQEGEIRARAHEVLRFTELDHLAGALAKTLSGGQQKLLELARTLMAEPRIVLLDEPGAGINPALMETLVEKILELHKRGITFVLIEHNMDLVMSICRPILVMAQGRLIFEGDADSVRSDPAVLDAYLGDVVP